MATPRSRLWQPLCQQLFARRRWCSPLRLTPAYLIPAAASTGFVIRLPEGSRSRCEKLISCRRISAGAAAIGVRDATTVPCASAHQSGINKFFIGCCIRPNILQNMHGRAGERHCQGSGRWILEIAMNNLEQCFSNFQTA